jgi:hypothetical protein
VFDLHDEMDEILGGGNCPRCNRREGELVYALGRPVSCNICVFEKLQEQGKADSYLPERTWVSKSLPKEFVEECKANTERWAREREQLLKGMK